MGKAFNFILGGIVGAGAALLLSPNSGERNRELVAEKAEYYTSHGGEVLQQATGVVRDRVRDASDVAKPTADDIRAKINEARDRIAEQVTRNSGVEDVSADVTDVAESLASDATQAAAEASDVAAEVISESE